MGWVGMFFYFKRKQVKNEENVVLRGVLNITNVPFRWWWWWLKKDFTILTLTWKDGMEFDEYVSWFEANWKTC